MQAVRQTPHFPSRGQAVFSPADRVNPGVHQLWLAVGVGVHFLALPQPIPSGHCGSATGRFLVMDVVPW